MTNIELVSYGKNSDGAYLVSTELEGMRLIRISDGKNVWWVIHTDDMRAFSDFGFLMVIGKASKVTLGTDRTQKVEIARSLTGCWLADQGDGNSLWMANLAVRLDTAWTKKATDSSLDISKDIADSLRLKGYSPGF